MFPVGITTNTFTVTANGQTTSCSFTVTVTDVAAPTITCPVRVGVVFLLLTHPLRLVFVIFCVIQTDIVVNNDAGICGAVVSFAPTATDNCGGVSVATSIASGVLFAAGRTTIVNALATDSSLNTAMCKFTVTVAPCADVSIAKTSATQEVVSGAVFYALTGARGDL